MIEIGVFHNGASDLPPVRTASGILCNDGTLHDVHLSAQRTILNQIRQGILADKLGFRLLVSNRAPFPARRCPR